MLARAAATENAAIARREALETTAAATPTPAAAAATATPCQQAQQADSEQWTQPQRK